MNERADQSTDTRTGDEPQRRATLLEQVPLLLALIVLWMMLWGSLTPLTILTGVVVALVVTRAFYLPPVELSGRFNPLWFAVFVGRVGIELFVASFEVAMQSFARAPVPMSAIVRVELRTRSDFIMTGTSLAVSLVPGSIVLEIDRANARLYVHTLGACTPADIEKARAHVLSLEHDLLRAWGSAAEWQKVR